VPTLSKPNTGSGIKLFKVRLANKIAATYKAVQRKTMIVSKNIRKQYGGSRMPNGNSPKARRAL
jgi:hypothetical protein